MCTNFKLGELKSLRILKNAFDHMPHSIRGLHIQTIFAIEWIFTSNVRINQWHSDGNVPHE